MIIGILIGPVGQILDGADFQTAAPYFGTIALILILFEGGLEIDLHEALGQARSAFLLGVTHFFLAAGGLFLSSRYLFDMAPNVAIFYGLVLGGTSPAVVLPVLQSLKLLPKTKALFSLETVICEVFTVVTTVLAINFYNSKESPSLIGTGLFVVHSFGTATWIAVVAAWAWNWVVPIIEKSGISHMMTLAYLFLLYGFASSIHAEPAITILLFGLFLENGHHISEWLQKHIPSVLHRWIAFPPKNDQRIFSTLFFELSFLVRTYFFVMVGLLFDFSKINISDYVTGMTFIVIFFLSRTLSLKSLQIFDRSVSIQELQQGLVTMPRGLATAVVALMVNQAHIPGTENLVSLAFLSILGTNILMAFLLLKTAPRKISG